MDETFNDPEPLAAATVVIERDRTTRHMRQDILAALAGQSRDLVVDLRQVDNLSSLGLAVLVGVRARQHSRQKTLTLVCGDRSDIAMALARFGLQGKFTTVAQIPPPW